MSEILIPAQCKGHTYKRGNKNTSIKGKAKGGRGSRRCQEGELAVLKIMQKTETTADESITDKPQLCSSLASSAFKLSLFPAPCTCVFRAETKSSNWLRKIYKEIKKPADTPFLCAFCDNKYLSSLSPPRESWSVRRLCLWRQPSQVSSLNALSELLPLYEQKRSFWLPQQSSCAVQVPAGEGFECVMSLQWPPKNQLRFPAVVSCYFSRTQKQVKCLLDSTESSQAAAVIK